MDSYPFPQKWNEITVHLRISVTQDTAFRYLGNMTAFPTLKVARLWG